MLNVEQGLDLNNLLHDLYVYFWFFIILISSNDFFLFISILNRE